jgi:hypothetical protein
VEPPAETPALITPPAVFVPGAPPVVLVPGAPPAVVIPGAPNTPDTPVVILATGAQVRGAIAIREISNVVRRAFVAGEAVRVAGRAPAGCLPKLHLDGKLIGAIATERDGSFDLEFATRDLAAGNHVAEVFCTSPAALLLRKIFWVAAPQSSSNVFAIVLVSLLVVYAICWVGLRTLAGTSVGVGRAGRSASG